MKGKLYYLCALLMALISSPALQAQYYYNDLLKLKESNAEYFILKAEKFSKIIIKSFDEDDTPSEGFFCEKKFNASFSQSEMNSESLFTEKSILLTYYHPQWGIEKVVTKTDAVTNELNYTYDSLGRVLKIDMTSQSNLNASKISERREYFYDDKGQPEKMIKSKDGVTTATVVFEKDSLGNIISEKPLKSSGELEYYYYYDGKNRLTDIVHFNPYVKKLLPDFIFEYNTSNQVKKMVSVDKTGTDYLNWRYSYTDQKLPEIQKCYSKQKKLIGTMEFEYRR